MRDEAAFVEFAEAVRGQLRRTAYLMCGDWDQASDHVQEGLIRVYVAWPRMTRAGREHAYARKAVVSAFLDHARRRSSTEFPAEPDRDRSSGQDLAESVASRIMLMTALADLPPRQRACVVLRYFDDLSVGDTAAVLGCSEGTVKSQTSRGLASLRSMFEGSSFGGPGDRRGNTMVNDLRELLSRKAVSPPHDDFDLGAVLAGGRRRVHRRRLALLGGTALATATIALAGSFASLDGWPPSFAPAGVPQPEAPTLRLADAVAAVEGTDYRVLASHTNENLNRDNGQYFEGVTDDGLILFRDGPRMDQPRPRFALMDPATGEKDWLPDLAIGQAQTWPLHLGEDRLMLIGAEGGMTMKLVVHAFDRERRQWDTMSWPDLPAVGDPFGAEVGPDDRLYVPVPATQGEPPEGGWPIGPGGEADDADAAGDTYRLWSASLTDVSDVRDEGLTVGSLAFTDSTMVWTDSTNGDSGRVHVRDLETGDEQVFDPRSGEKCNLLSFGATVDRVVMGQYCGTYDGGIRDDRVQVLDTNGGQVVTLQGSGIDDTLTSDAGGRLVTVTSHESDRAGTYVYDLHTGQFLRITEKASSWSTAGPTQEGQFLWNTPENGGRGMTQHLGKIIN